MNFRIKVKGSGKATRRLHELRLKRLPQKRKTCIHAVIDVGVIVVNLFVGVANTGSGETARERPSAILNRALIIPPIVDGDTAERP
jgi:hypothetical protein